jgi:hypothetical protein
MVSFLKILVISDRLTCVEDLRDIGVVLEDHHPNHLNSSLGMDIIKDQGSISEDYWNLRKMSAFFMG